MFNCLLRYKSSLKSVLKKISGRLNKLFEAFALQKNWKRLIETKPNDGSEIRAVHGIRFMSALGLIMSHKAMALFYNPYLNRTDMVEVNKK